MQEGERSAQLHADTPHYAYTRTHIHTRTDRTDYKRTPIQTHQRAETALSSATSSLYPEARDSSRRWNDTRHKEQRLGRWGSSDACAGAKGKNDRSTEVSVRERTWEGELGGGHSRGERGSGRTELPLPRGGGALTGMRRGRSMHTRRERVDQLCRGS